MTRHRREVVTNEDGERALKWVPVSDSGAAADAQPRNARDTEQMAAQMRQARGRALAASDWTQLADAPITAARKTAWKAYRRALRDAPKQEGFPWAMEWPEPERFGLGEDEGE